MARFRLTNASGYNTEDLKRFFNAGLDAFGVGWRDITVVAAPQRSRGCANIGKRGRPGRNIVIAIAPPSRFTMKRLCRLLEHEMAHTLGVEHEDMPARLLWSRGNVPRWAKGLRIRYEGRAPDQLALTRKPPRDHSRRSPVRDPDCAPCILVDENVREYGVGERDALMRRAKPGQSVMCRARDPRNLVDVWRK
jgi:hypothetical protein